MFYFFNLLNKSVLEQQSIYFLLVKSNQYEAIKKEEDKIISLSQACECFVAFADGVNQRVDLFLPVHARGRNCFRADASNPDFAAHSREGKQTFSFVRIIRNQFDNLIVSSDTEDQYCSLCE